MCITVSVAAASKAVGVNSPAKPEVYQASAEALKKAAQLDAASGSNSEAIEKYEAYLQKKPTDLAARSALARLYSRTNDYAKASAQCRLALSINSNFVPALVILARILSWQGQFERSLALYDRALTLEPDSVAALTGKAYVLLWQKRPDGSIELFDKTLNRHPNSCDALQGKAEALVRMQKPSRAQDHKYKPALELYRQTLQTCADDPQALLGIARIRFYQGKFDLASSVVERVLAAEPENFEAVVLLAKIEHARHHRRRAMALLKKAGTIKPGGPELASLKSHMRSESAVTLTTTASFAREIGPPTESGTYSGLPNEDLRTYIYGTTIGLKLLPGTQSYFSFSALPTDSPPGPDRDANGNQIPTGITGAAAPSEFLYRQSTLLSKSITLRGGAGFVRFGPGDPVLVPVQNGRAQIPGADHKVIGQAGISFMPVTRIRLDLDASRGAITYTPTSIHFGVMEDELKGRVSYSFNPDSAVQVALWRGVYSSEAYPHSSGAGDTVTLQRDRDRSNGVSISFNELLFRSGRLSFEAGYMGIGYEFSGGEKPFLGFFAPSFYQRHELVPRLKGKLWGPLGYDFTAGIGVQQVGHSGPVMLAWKVAPEISMRVNQHLTLLMGYTHYNAADILGPLRGNAVQLKTQWSF